MELARAFRFGGNVNEAFQYGLTKIIERFEGAEAAGMKKNGEVLV